MRSITRYLIPGGLLAGAITLGALGLSTGASTPNDVQQPVIPHLVSIPPQGAPVVPAPVNPPPVVISGPPVVAPVAPKAPVIPVPKAPAPPVIKAPVTTPPPPPVVTQTCIPASSCTVTSSVSNTSTVVTSPPAPVDNGGSYSTTFNTDDTPSYVGTYTDPTLAGCLEFDANNPANIIASCFPTP